MTFNKILTLTFITKIKLNSKSDNDYKMMSFLVLEQNPRHSFI